MEDQFAPLSPMPLPAHRQTPSAVSDAPSLDSIARPLSAHSIAPHAFYDLVIIGAGPAALAVVARILETRPAALYTEQEHHFLHWLSKSGGGGQQRNAAQPGRNPRHLRLIRTKASGRGAERIIAGERALHDDEKCACPGEMKILVVDKVGQGWLSHWNNMFKALEIQRESDCAAQITRSCRLTSPAPRARQTCDHRSSSILVQLTSTVSWLTLTATAATPWGMPFLPRRLARAHTAEGTPRSSVLTGTMTVMAQASFPMRCQPDAVVSPIWLRSPV